jgi:EmrB/QacA subfamily drug resistance transporter
MSPTPPTAGVATGAAGAGPAVRPGPMMLGLMLGVSLAALDMTIVATSVRTIADDLGGLGLQAWATTSYLIAGAITTPLYGKLGDVHGRKPLVLVAISIFVVGSALCASAGSMEALAAFRAVQGVGAGGLFSLSVAIVADAVAPRERARYTGRLIAVYGVFGVLGPVVGGLLADTPVILGITGWRWVFLINVPVGVLAVAVVTAALRLPQRRRPQRVDWAGAGTLAAGLVPLLIVADEGRNWGWASYPAMLCYAVGIGGLGLFLLTEQQMGEDALLPLRLFGVRTFRLGALAGLVVGFGMFGVLTLLPLHLQVVGGAGPTQAGLLMLPLVAGIMATTAASGRVIARTARYRSWLVFGCVMMIVGLLWMSGMNAATPFPAVAACMTVFGIGLGANLQAMTLALQNAVPAPQVGVATATSVFTRQLGGSVGAAVFLSILFATVQDRVARAFRGAATDPGFRAVVTDPVVLADPANAGVVAALRAGGSGPGSALLEDSSFLARLHPELAQPILTGFSESATISFTVGALVLVVALGAALAMPDLRLRAPEGSR